MRTTLPDGTIIEFPDDTTPEERQAIAQQVMGGQQPQQGFDARQMVRNIPGSAAQFVKDMTAPIHSPVATAKGLWKAGSGLAQLAIPGEQGNEVYARAVGEGLKERYGGTDRLRRTLQDDPVGLAGDVAGLVTGGAGLATKAGLKGASVAGTVGRNLDPVVAAQRAVGTGILEAWPRKAAASALKLPTTMPRKDRAAVVETVLENKLLPNEKGYQRLVDLQEDLGNQIDVLIAQANATGQRIPASRLLRGMKDVRGRLGGAGINAMEDLRAVQTTIDDWLDGLKAQGIRTLGIEDLQKIKTDAYKRINFNKSQQKAVVGSEEAAKSIAGEARKQIEKQVPAIADVNRRYGDLERAKPVFERAASRIENRDFMGIGTPVKTTAGGAIGGIPGALFGLATGGMDMPSVKSRAAIQAEALRKMGFGKGMTPAETWTLQRALAAQAGRMRDEDSKGNYIPSN